ncbi:MAG: TonB-dependent receptor domain-containing protein [Caulobacterales bacterium]
MSIVRRLAGGGMAAFVLAMSASAVYAQETTGGVRGAVTSAGGAAAGGAVVTITHLPTGTTRTTVASADGRFDVRGLQPGGPYKIAATGAGQSGETQIATIGVGDPVDVSVAMQASSSVSEVVVAASAAPVRATVGVGTVFERQQIEALPTFSRDLKEIARLDPFAVIQDPDNQNAISFAGANTRFNQLTVDGIRQNDDFGLNNNGYPTQRSPISLEAIEAVQVSVAPYSVINNGFLGGAINAVTKSGGNTLHGSAYGEYDSSRYRGDKIRGAKAGAPFEEDLYGFSLGGPVVKDRLFFFLDYEKYQDRFSLDEGPADSGRSVVIPRITEAAVATFRAATQSLYGYDPGSFVTSAPPAQDTKWLGKVTWNITNDHRLAVTYQDTNSTAFNGSPSSDFVENDSTFTPRLSLNSDQFVKDDHLTTVTADLNSDWTQNLSTEIRAGHKEVKSTQIPLGGLSVGQTSVNVAGEPGVLAGSGSPTILFGADSFRNDNFLDVKTDTAEAIGRYAANDHHVMFGARIEHQDIFNVFVPSSFGEYTFSSYANYLAKIASAYKLVGGVDPSLGTQPATTHTARTGAARLSFSLASFYAEDTWQATPDLSVLMGVRYDRFFQDSMPTFNANFLSREGFSNQQNLNGKDIVLPRAYVKWTPRPGLELSIGAGRFSSQGVNVWISDPFANDGVRQTNAVCPAGPFTNVDLTKAPAGCTFTPGNGNVNAIDPALQIPSAWKADASVRYAFDFNGAGEFGHNWVVEADYIDITNENALYWKDLRAQQIGTAPDGRPVYARATNGTIGANVFDMELTNTRYGGGGSQAVSFSLAKTFNEGFFEGLNGKFIYTYTHATDANPMTSSIADSSYIRFASSDPNNPKAATSDYEIRNRFALELNYSRKFFGDNKSSIGLFAQERSGIPFSYTFVDTKNGNFDREFGDVLTQSFSGRQAAGNQLFYVPMTDSTGAVTATSDPKVSYAAGFDVGAFNRYLSNTGLIRYAGEIAPRNAFRTHDVTTIDVRFSQEIPAFFPRNAKLLAYIDIINLGNLLNNHWGVLDQYDFYRGVPVVSIACPTGQIVNGQHTCAGASQYVYSGLRTATGTVDKPVSPFTVINPSLWQLKFGLKYRF